MVERRLLLTATGIILADALVKTIIRSGLEPGGRIPVLGDAAGIVHLANTGASFGILQGQNFLLAIIAIAAAVAIYLLHKTLAPWKGGDILAGVLLGGVLGNAIDRIALGAVTDFIQVGGWPPFNLADSALTLGVLFLIYKSRR